MADLLRRIQKLEEALKPPSKGHRIVMSGFGLDEEAAQKEVARFRDEGYDVTLICFGTGESPRVT